MTDAELRQMREQMDRLVRWSDHQLSTEHADRQVIAENLHTGLTALLIQLDAHLNRNA